MSSPYPVLDNKPIDQWKVTELKEELKRRKLATKGLKDDLIRRLDDALRAERDSSDDNDNENDNNIDGEEEPNPDREEQVDDVVVDTQDNEKDIPQDAQVVTKDIDSAKEEVGNGVDSEDKPQVESEHVGSNAVLDAKVDDESVLGKLDKDVSVVDSNGGGEEESVVTTIDAVEVVTHTQTASASVDTVETDVTETNISVTLASSVLESQDNGIKVEKEDPLASNEGAVLNSPIQNNQVSEVSPSLGFQVKSDSISTDSVSINQKNEQKNNLNADNFHIELDNVKPEMVQPSSCDVPRNGGDISPLDDQEPFGDQGSIEALDGVDAMNVDLSKKIGSADGGSSEKLNLDRSSGDDSMEEDVLESKQVESNHVFSEMQESSELRKDHVMEDGSPVDAKRAGFSATVKSASIEIRSNVAASAEKRKLEDQEFASNNEPPKRRRWNTEPIKVPDPQPSRLTPTTPTTPKDGFQSRFQKRNFNRSDSTLSGGDTPKERVVPPSPKSPTTSLKIDHFLRPFTLKAVQELLTKTGTICGFWMDHIKTHCFVTFSKVEEAIETRNALYNLQWPPNGGKLLVADFVDPQEVNSRLQAPPPAPAPAPAPVNNRTAPPPPPIQSQPQPSPRDNVLRQQLPPPPSLPPPPPLVNPHIVRERLPLPPPPPLIKKPDPPIVTLDDLFRKTRATPRIYYLPLSEEQVAAKLARKSVATD